MLSSASIKTCSPERSTRCIVYLAGRPAADGESERLQEVREQWRGKDRRKARGQREEGGWGGGGVERDVDGSVERLLATFGIHKISQAERHHL